MGEAIDREIRLALWKIHILHHAAKRPVYGLWMIDELAEHGHVVSPGTLYPILARMEANGWLSSDSPDSSKARRNYRITAVGQEVLEVLRREIVELHEEVVGGREPQHDLHRAQRRRAHQPTGRHATKRIHHPATK
jgi:PadR family transcriptional regulator